MKLPYRWTCLNVTLNIINKKTDLYGNIIFHECPLNTYLDWLKQAAGYTVT